MLARISLVPSRPRRFRMWRHLSSLSGKFASGHSDSANRPGYEAGLAYFSPAITENKRTARHHGRSICTVSTILCKHRKLKNWERRQYIGSLRSRALGSSGHKKTRLACLPRAPQFSLSPTNSKRLLRRLVYRQPPSKGKDWMVREVFNALIGKVAYSRTFFFLLFFRQLLSASACCK